MGKPLFTFTEEVLDALNATRAAVEEGIVPGGMPGVMGGGAPRRLRRLRCGAMKSGLLAAALAFLVFISLLPVLDNDFVNYDDDTYVTANRTSTGEGPGRSYAGPSRPLPA